MLTGLDLHGVSEGSLQLNLRLPGFAPTPPTYLTITPDCQINPFLPNLLLGYDDLCRNRNSDQDTVKLCYCIKGNEG